MDDINQWISNTIEIQNQRIDDAKKRNWHDVKSRSEGYLEALYQFKAIISKTNEKPA